MSIEKITLISSVITGFIAVLIAYRQMKIEKYKLNHDLFDMRMEVYNHTYKIMDSIILGNRIEEELFDSFIKSKNISNFIFSNRVSFKLKHYNYLVFEYRYYYDFDPEKSNIEISEKVQEILNIKSENIDNPKELLAIIRKYFKEEFKKLNFIFGRDISIN